MPRPIKVLMVVDHALGISGPHRHVVGVLNCLSIRPEVEISLLTSKIDPEEPYSSQIKNINLEFDPGNIFAVPKNLSLMWKMTRDCDIMYIPNGLKSFAYGWLFRSKKHKLVAGPNVSSLPLLMPPTDPNFILTVWMCDSWIESCYFRAKYAISGGANPEDFAVIRHALDINRFNPSNKNRQAWKEFDLDPDRLKLLFCAQGMCKPSVGFPQNERKGTTVLLQAFRILQDEFPEADLIFVGNEGKHLVEENRDLKNFYHLGEVYGDKLACLFASCDVACFPSHFEPFGFVALEASASGVPVVASKAGGLQEIIEDGVTGFHAQLKPVEASPFFEDADERLADKLRLLLSDSQMREKFGKAGRERAEKFFSEKRLGDDFVDLFQAVMEGKRTHERLVA